MAMKIDRMKLWPLFMSVLLAGCTSWHRVSKPDDFFKNSDRAITYTVIAAAPVAEGDLEEPNNRGVGERLSPDALSDPRTGPGPTLEKDSPPADQPESTTEVAPPPDIYSTRPPQYSEAEVLLPAPGVEEDSEEGLGTFINWIVPRSTIPVFNSSGCFLQITVNIDENPITVGPAGGRYGVDVGGLAGSEKVIVAAGQCLNPQNRLWYLKGFASYRVCAPTDGADRANPWFVTETDLQLKPPSPPPCQQPQNTYPVGGWRSGWRPMPTSLGWRRSRW